MKRRTFSTRLAAGIVGLAGGATFMPQGALAQRAVGSVRGTVKLHTKRLRRIKPKRDHAGAVVYLQGVPDSKPRGRSKVIEIRQIDENFEPKVAVVTVGTKISFPNDDKMFHNVYSRSKAAAFDLGQYKSGTTKVIKMEQPGTVEVYCNLHHDMRATVLVVDTKHYAMTDHDGSFEIRNVPVGTYRYVSWLADGSPVSGTVTVVADRAKNLEIAMIEDPRPHSHADKDGKPYAPY